MKKTLLLFVFITQLLNGQTAIGPILTNPRALVVIDDFAYFEDNNQIKRLDLNNSSSLTTVIANLNITPYTFEEGPNGFFIPNTGGNNVVLATINGTSVSPNFNYIDGTGGAIGFAFTSDNGDVYFTRNGTANSGQLRLLLSSPNSSSLVVNLPASHTDITDVATIGADFYFTSIQGVVWHYNINNPSAGFTSVVSTGGNVLTGVEVTQNYLYYVNASNNRVVRVNRANGSGAVNLFMNLGIQNIDIADNIVYGISSNQNQDRLYFYTDPQLPPPCAIPNNITATVTNGTDALVTWDAVTNANSYDVAYVESGQPLGSATVINTTNTSQVLNNLNSSLTYDIYIRTNCNSGTTNWSIPIQFGLPGIVYVDIDATGNNDGSSWADAYTSIEDAISSAVIGDELWIAEGEYTPAISSFLINKRLTIYGGFNGTETQLSQRDFINNLSIFSGDVLGNDNLGTFPFLVGEPTRQDNLIRIININANDVILDGISVRGAHTNNATAFNAIAVNSAIQNFTLRNSEIAYHFNSGANSGINMQPIVDANFILDNNRFHHNQSNAATAIYIFTNNAITANVSIKNNLFYENRIQSQGTVFSGPAGWVRAFANGSIINLELINNTFTKNTTVIPTSGATETSVFGISESQGTINSTVENNIFWDNIDLSDPNLCVPPISRIGGSSFGNLSTSNANISACNLPASTPGQNVDPLFTDPANNDFTLQSGSPAIDIGNNSFASGTDLLGFQRITNGTIDLGAYEFGSTLSVSDVIQDKQFKIYPNPVVNSINVVSQHSLKNITIYSILGTKVLSSYENTIDVSNLKTGVYIMKIETIKGQIVSKRFIKE